MAEMLKGCIYCKNRDLCEHDFYPCDENGSGFKPNDYAKLRYAIEWRLESYEKDIHAPDFKDKGETNQYIIYNLRNLCVALLASVDEDNCTLKGDKNEAIRN